MSVFGFALIDFAFFVVFRGVFVDVAHDWSVDFTVLGCRLLVYCLGGCGCVKIAEKLGFVY